MRSPLFEQQHMAQQDMTPGWTQPSSKMLRVVMNQDVLAAKGAMVAYKGNVTFTHEGSGDLGRLVRRMISSDDAPLMRCAGPGEIYFARLAEDIFTMQLEGDGVSVNGRNILAFDSSLHWDIHRVQGAGVFGAGMFNTSIQGHGTVALTSDGPPVLFDCSQQPVMVDMQAAVCWSLSLTPQLHNSMNFRSLIRGGSGEAFQYVFHGPGFVVVQPSEGAAATAAAQ